MYSYIKVIFGRLKKTGPKDIFLLVGYSYVQHSYMEVLLYSFIEQVFLFSWSMRPERLSEMHVIGPESVYLSLESKS